MRTIEFTSSLDDCDHNHIRVRLVIENGDVKDIMYQYETFYNNKWLAIVRYDCAHGFFHRDILFPNGDKEKQIIAVDNLKNASKYAEQDLKDRWEWYRERYINTIKEK
jgi:hypothetical protein